MKKINKPTARKMYANKQSFIMVPCNMRPDSMFAVEIKPGWMFRNFDVMYNEFLYYNCNPETGRRIAFYVKEE